MKTNELQTYISQIKIPQNQSHKGENGKLLLIGGSKLFHAASKWSLDVASKFVDMVFYSSVLENNELVKQAKQEFWNGLVINRSAIEDYIEEADAILIGPGMERNEETKKLVNSFLEKYSQKKWVIDAGALQMVNPKLLNQNHIITPHAKEMERFNQSLVKNDLKLEDLKVTVVLKGEEDTIIWFEDKQKNQINVLGGNPGMTKGGTGDVLAGLIAALYCNNSARISAIVGSFINKKAGDDLYKNVGPFFNASDLVDQVPKTFWKQFTSHGAVK